MDIGVFLLLILTQTLNHILFFFNLVKFYFLFAENFYLFFLIYLGLSFHLEYCGGSIEILAHFCKFHFLRVDSLVSILQRFIDSLSCKSDSVFLFIKQNFNWKVYRAGLNYYLKWLRVSTLQLPFFNEKPDKSIWPIQSDRSSNL